MFIFGIGSLAEFGIFLLEVQVSPHQPPQKYYFSKKNLKTIKKAAGKIQIFNHCQFVKFQCQVPATLLTQFV